MVERVPGQKILAVTLTEGEIAEIREDMEAGKLPKDYLDRYYEALDQNVFGHDAKKDHKGNYIEQGIASKGHETANHFAALLKAEREGFEPKGSYETAVRELWKRDPQRAEQLRLPMMAA